MRCPRHSLPSLKIKNIAQSSQQERSYRPLIVSSQQLVIFIAQRGYVPLSNETYSMLTQALDENGGLPGKVAFAEC
jgi:hypothetical protein